MPKPVKKAAPKVTKKAASADPMLRARQLQAEHMERFEQSEKPWAPAPAPVAAPTFEEQLSEHMRALGRKGGTVSGSLRKQNIPEEERRRIASKAARQRWERVAAEKAATKKR